MGQLLSKIEIDNLLAELQNTKAKRRWSTVQQLAKLQVNDERIALALENLALADPADYVRAEAQSTVRAPVYRQDARGRRRAGRCACDE